MGKPASNLLNKRFGKLVVVKRLETNKIRAHWLCVCDCGNETIAETSILNRKKDPKRSCGCMISKKIDMTGMRFGRLSVVKSIKNPGDRRHKWLCKCDCGEETNVPRTSLVHGLTTSCGCYAVEKFVKFTKSNIKEKHHNWNPNLSNQDRINDRKYPEYSEWRRLVFERNKYICQKCLKKSNGNLNAHHIENYSSTLEKRILLDNGVTLCKECHDNFHHIFSNHDNTIDQLKEFMELY